MNQGACHTHAAHDDKSDGAKVDSLFSLSHIQFGCLNFLLNGELSGRLRDLLDNRSYYNVSHLLTWNLHWSLWMLLWYLWLSLSLLTWYYNRHYRIVLITIHR